MLNWRVGGEWKSKWWLPYPKSKAGFYRPGVGVGEGYEDLIIIHTPKTIFYLLEGDYRFMLVYGVSHVASKGRFLFLGGRV